MTRRKGSHLVAVLALTLSSVTAVNAQFLVLDAANLVQNILTAARSLVQIENQIQMLENEALNLRNLGFNSLARLRDTLGQISALMRRAQGLAFQLEQATQQFSIAYPNVYTDGVSRAQMDADAQVRWVNSHEAVRTAIQMQAQVNQNLADDEEVLADLVTQSQGAEGALQAAQASNQLLALNAKHIMQFQEIAVAQDRSVAAENARAIEAQERSREFRHRFLTVTPYDPQDVQGVN